MRHIDFLDHRHVAPPGTIIFGLPRLKPAAGALMQSSPMTPSDDEMLLAIATVNLFRPRALPFVNTREQWNMCLAIASGGGTLFTLNCKTIPGGYAHQRVGYQFPTFDFGVDLYGNELRARGIEPVFDWTFESVRPEHGMEHISQ